MDLDKKKFLIVTASIGAGHNRAAEAIVEEIQIKYPNSRINTVDFMSAKTAYLNGMLKDAYLKMLSFLPDMYDFLYHFTAGKIRGISIQGLVALAMKNDMDHLIKEFEADVVICTHPFPCAAAAYLKKSKRLDFVLAAVITDFAVHQMWVYKEVDLYFVAGSELQKELVARGIGDWHIHDTGIPISLSFNAVYDRMNLMDKFGLQQDAPVILLMGGGLGMGGVKFTLECLEKMDRYMQVLVVTGENPNLRMELKQQSALSRHKVQVWGYSNNIQELMAVADLLISKPGALTISEALAMELPMVLHEPIPGQEKENAAYIERTGAAMWVKDPVKLVEIVDAALSNPEQLSAMRKNAKQYKRPCAAQEIVGIIGSYIVKDYTRDNAVSM